MADGAKSSMEVKLEDRSKIETRNLFFYLEEEERWWESFFVCIFVVHDHKGLNFECYKKSHFKVKIFHQDRFGLERGPLKYLGGKTTFVDNCNEGGWSLIEVYGLVTKQGYLKQDIAAMWYKSKKKNAEEGLRMLRNNNDAIAMAKVGVKEEIVELFVIHKTRDDKEVSIDVQLHESLQMGAH
ncbi:hypothetical protein PIB30_053215 [Stylosanthes scabra]|uniref:PB1-like domain-containing protein n=1 Tax=Stylosanthes scabra TaxID=79078 RepID=A0ABU6SJ99_9FABA|nr:hypothetical protein [Stylosanthes scabra]